MSLLFPGTSHLKLAKAISKKYGLKLGKRQIKKFSCKETYIKIEEDVRNQNCFILQTATQNVNDELMEICLLADALRRHHAKGIKVIIPNFGYGRQDRRAAFGEPISARVVANMLVCAGVNHIITFDLHSDQIEGFFDVPVDNLKCYSLFAAYFKKKRLADPVVVAPDAGAAKIARRLADLIECPMAILHKRRPGHHKIEHTHLVGDIKNKTVILFDDMIDTARSICAAKDKAAKQGAQKEIYAAATHGIFSRPAFERLKQANFKEIVVTDTIPSYATALAGRLKNLKVLSVVGLLREVL